MSLRGWNGTIMSLKGWNSMVQWPGRDPVLATDDTSNNSNMLGYSMMTTTLCVTVTFITCWFAFLYFVYQARFFPQNRLALIKQYMTLGREIAYMLAISFCVALIILCLFYYKLYELHLAKPCPTEY